MTDNEINGTIAEILGWRFDPTCDQTQKYIATACWIRPGGEPWQLENLPNYCNNLNAMQDVWNWLRQNGDGSDDEVLFWEGLRDRYGYELFKRAGLSMRKNGGSIDYTLANLTAKQKAECFISSMNVIMKEIE